MKNIKDYLEAKNTLQQTAFLVMKMAGVDILDLPRFIREVADDIEEKIEEEKDK